MIRSILTALALGTLALPAAAQEEPQLTAQGAQAFIAEVVRDFKVQLFGGEAFQVRYRNSRRDQSWSERDPVPVFVASVTSPTECVTQFSVPTGSSRSFHRDVQAEIQYQDTLNSLRSPGINWRNVRSVSVDRISVAVNTIDGRHVFWVTPPSAAPTTPVAGFPERLGFAMEFLRLHCAPAAPRVSNTGF